VYVSWSLSSTYGGDSGNRIFVLYWRCSLIRVSVIRGSTVTTSVGTVDPVLAEELEITEDTRVPIVTHDLYMSEGTFVPNIAHVLEMSIFHAACALRGNL
jgi:hypothetical protein